MFDIDSGNISRRSLLRTSAFAAGALATGGAGLLSSASPAAAALPTTLPISGAKTQFFKNVTSPIAGARMQSFAFDSVNRKMFTLTRVDGSSGDLEVRRILVGAGSEGKVSSERMIVPGAGHGVAFGVEPIGSSSYIWLEYAADSSLYGTKLARFKFVAGRNTKSQSRSDDLFRYSNSSQITCSVDHIYDYGDGLPRLAVRRSHADDVPEPTTRLEVYRLHGLNALPELEWSARTDAHRVNGAGGQTFQGWTFYANRYYAITGDHGQDNTYIHQQTPVEPKNPDWHLTPKMVSSPEAKQSIPSGIDDCEPEGIAAYRPDSSEKVRLNFGLTAGGTPRKNSVYYRTA